MNGAGAMNQKRRPIIIKELETRYEKTTAIYNGTMERLRRINGGRPVTDKAAVVMLSQEIEAYREQIQRLRGMSTKLLTEDIVRTDIFAKNVKRLLDEKCMSQRELADTVGVTEVAMSRYLNDGRMPKGPILYNMAKVLGVSIEYLFEEHPEETAAGSGPQAEPKLKPCPFCGSVVHFNYNGELEPDGIRCEKCKMLVRYYRIKVNPGEKFSVCMEKLTEAWNRRTPEA